MNATTMNTRSARPKVPATTYFRWPAIVAGLLMLHVGLMIWAATIAVRRGTAPVIPNYYERSLKWDEEKAARLQTEPVSPVAPAVPQK